MYLYDPLDRSEADPRAFDFLRSLKGLKHLEDSFEIFLFDSGSIVPDVEFPRGAVRDTADLDLPPLVCP